MIAFGATKLPYGQTFYLAVPDERAEFQIAELNGSPSGDVTGGGLLLP